MRLYKYYGNISAIEIIGLAEFIILEELNNDKKAPVYLKVCGALAKYIYDIDMTGAEERYLNANWYYDRGLYLCRIEIPSTSTSIPAKVITQEDYHNDKLVIFGPGEHIKTSNPAPMSKETFWEWMRWKSEHT